MQDLQPSLRTGQWEPKTPRHFYRRLPLIAFLMACAGGICLLFANAYKFKHSTFAARDDISDESIRQWLPPAAKSIEMQRRLYRPVMHVKADVSEDSFRTWCKLGRFEPYELTSDFPIKGVKNGLWYRGAHDGVEAMFDRDQGKFILMQYGWWYQFPPDRNALRNH